MIKYEIDPIGTTYTADINVAPDRKDALVAVPDRSSRLRAVVAGFTALSLTATGILVYNRPVDPWLRPQSYDSEGLGGITGTGGTGVIDQGEPSTQHLTPVVLALARTKHKTFTVTQWRNKPADSTPNKPKANSVEYKLQSIEDAGWTIDKLDSIGESSDHITDPDSHGKKERETGSPQEDWSLERAKVGKSVIKIALDGTSYGALPIKLKTEQDVLNKHELAIFGKIADSLGYQSSHELTTAVLMGREFRPKALASVQKYILDEMGYTLKAHASKQKPPTIGFVYNGEPAIPPVIAPFYNPHPAAWWGEKAEVTLQGEDQKFERAKHKSGGKTQSGHRAATARRKQPADLNDGGNNGTRGQRGPHPKSARTRDRIAARSN